MVVLSSYNARGQPLVTVLWCVTVDRHKFTGNTRNSSFHGDIPSCCQKPKKLSKLKVGSWHFRYITPSKTGSRSTSGRAFTICLYQKMCWRHYLQRGEQDLQATGDTCGRCHSLLSLLCSRQSVGQRDRHRSRRLKRLTHKVVFKEKKKKKLN